MADSISLVSRLRPVWRHVNRAALGHGVVTMAVCLATALAYFAPARERLSGGQGLWRIFFPNDNSRYLGDGIDLPGTLWTFDSVTRLMRGEVGTVRPDLFAPIGWDQGVSQGFAWADAVLASPLVLAMGALDFYNLYLLLLLAGCAAALTKLATRVGAPLPVALGLASSAMLNEFFQGEIAWGRPTQVHILFLVGFAWFVLRLLGPNRRPVRDGLAAGGMLALCGYVYWFSAIAVGVVVATAYLLHLLLDRTDLRARLVGGAVLTLTAVAASILPTWRITRELLFGDATKIIPGLAQQAPIVVALGPFEIPLRGARPLTADLGEIWLSLRGLGYPGLLLMGLLVALAVPWGWRRTLPWALAGLVWLTLPMGPGVLWDLEHMVPTAFGLLEVLLPPLQRCESTQRLMVGPLVAMVVAAAMVSGALLNRVPAVGSARTLLSWTAGLLLLAFAFETAPDSSYQRVSGLRVPPIFADATARWPGGIIDVPLTASGSAYVYQMSHGRILLGGPGISGRHTRPAAHVAYVEQNSFLQLLDRLAQGTSRPRERWSAADLERLHNDGFGIVLVHLQAVKSKLPAFQAVLGPNALVQGSQYAAWPLPDAR